MLNRNYDILFSNRGVDGAIVDFASPAFQMNHVKSDFAKPQLRTEGTLNGGTAKLQTLRPGVSLASANMSVGSTDWTDTPHTINSLLDLSYSSLNYRLRITGLGASANFSAWIIYNAE